MDRIRDYLDNLFIVVIGGLIGWLLGLWFIPPWGQLIGAIAGVLTGLILSEKIANAFVKAKSRLRRWLLEGLEVKLELDKTLAGLSQKADNVESALEEARNGINSMTEALSQVKLGTLYLLEGCVRAYYLDGKHENVIELCNSLQQIDKTNYGAYYYRGCSKAARGNHKLALPDLLAASNIREADSNVHMSLAETYIALAQFQDAINEAELALRLNTNNPLEAHAIISRAREEMEEYPEALAERDICLSISPRHANSVACKIRILAKLAAKGFGSWDEVFRFSDENIALRPNIASYYVNKALACLNRNAPGDWETAMNLFSKAETVDPRDNRIYQSKGRVLLQAAKTEQDETKRGEMLQEVSEIAKKGIFYCSVKLFRPVFYELERKALVLSGRLDEALTVAKKGLTDNPDNPWNWLKLTISFLALESYHEAIISCKEALKSCDFSKAPLSRLWILYVLCMAKAFQLLPHEEISESLDALISEFDNDHFFKADRWPDWDELLNLTDKLLSKTNNPLANDLSLLIKGELNKVVFKKRWIQ